MRTLLTAEVPVLPDLGRALLILGAALAAVGLLLILAGKVPHLGRLPGDIVVERKNFVFFAPLTTSLIVSLLLSFLWWLWRR